MPGSSCYAHNHHHTKNSNAHDSIFHNDAHTSQTDALIDFFSTTSSANAHKSATEPHVRPGGSRHWGSSQKAAPTGAPLHYSQFPTCRKRGAAVSEEESCSNPQMYPQRVSWQRVREFQDPYAHLVQAGTRTCPEGLCGESCSHVARLWRCGPASRGTSDGSMPHNMSASSHACPTRPLVPSVSQNVTPAVARRCVSSPSFFLSSHSRRQSPQVALATQHRMRQPTYPGVGGRFFPPADHVLRSP